jgi:hypothetical protein
MNAFRVQLTERKELGIARRAVVELGRAPDGIPIYLWVERGSSPAELLAPVAARLGYGRPEDYEGEPFGAVARQVEQLLYERDVQEVPTNESGPRRCFISRQPVRRVLGTTLLSRLLTPDEGLPAEEPQARAYDTRQSVLAAEEQPPAQRREVRAELGELRLAVPLADAATLLARRVRRAGRKYAFVSSRKLIPESLSALRSARFVGQRAGEDHIGASGKMSEAEAYLGARRQAALEDIGWSWACWIEREEIAQLIRGVAAALARLHAAGEVHGDVKPGNVLVEGAPRLIDSLGLQPGEPSIAMTPGWAAPEQVLGEPVSLATDQYPVGVMLRQLLGGVMFGEEVTMVVPTGGTGVERFALLKNPGVYLDRDQAPIPAEGVPAWQKLIARCLAFDPTRRFSRMEELAAELERVSGSFPLEGELSLWLSFGSLARADDAAVAPTLAWVAYEQSSGPLD